MEVVPLYAIRFTQDALRDIEYWRQSGNLFVQQRITTLLKDIRQHPFTGIGKPEMLRHLLSGSWSRRINKEHRIVYEVRGSMITIESCRYHYSKK